jgi:hypothetical protein
MGISFFGRAYRLRQARRILVFAESRMIRHAAAPDKPPAPLRSRTLSRRFKRWKKNLPTARAVAGKSYPGPAQAVELAPLRAHAAAPAMRLRPYVQRNNDQSLGVT